MSRYNTELALKKQHRKGYIDAIICKDFGYRNDLGKITVELDLAYIAGWNAGYPIRVLNQI
jgi:hypothetical protein